METIVELYSYFDCYIALWVAISYIIVDWLYAKYTLEVVALKPGTYLVVNSEKKSK